MPKLLFILLLMALPITQPAEYTLIKIETRLGEIFIWLHNETPRHRDSFIALADAHYWDSLTFNRVIPNFVAQGGCPDTPEGFSDSPYLLEPEFVEGLGHIYGALGAGRDDNPGKLSAGCQFYIVQNPDGVHRLDNNYTIFGQVIKGMDVVDAIVNVPRDNRNKPNEDIPIKVRTIKLNTEQVRALNAQYPPAN